LHTNDAPGTISRMVDMGVDPFLVASATLLISAQRLLKKLCPECKQPCDVPRERLLSVGFVAQEAEQIKQLHMAQGCKRCTHGYKGRFAILETMKMDEDLRRMVIKGASSVDLKAKALEKGMLSLRRCALLNSMRGKTSIEEALSTTLAD
ncbi:MAG: type II secretion system protein GspE, partial [Planctomycetes bacterium]|nr:type II secretion system protein GspE [Planctomycetota bacterium]